MAAALVGGALLSASLQVLFDRLGSRSLIDFILRRRSEEGLLIKKLAATIFSVEAILEEALKRRFANPAVKEWLKELEDTVMDAQNLLEEIGAGRLKGKPGIRSRIELLQEILDRLEHVSRQKDVIDWKATSHVALTNSILVDESAICGRADDKDAMVSILVSESVMIGDDPTRVLAMAGAAGIGKTTLAQFVYNDGIVQSYFDIKVWVCVSSGLHVYAVTKTIFEAVTERPCDIEDLNLLQLRLQEELTGKRLLLMLDDLCYIDENRMDWEVLLGPFRCCEPGSAVVVTTQSENVSRAICTSPVYHLNPLSSEDCWILFSKQVFDGGSSITDPGLEAMGREIVKKCRGNPLAIKSLGIILRTKPNREEWDRILKNDIWDSTRDMTTILRAIKHGISKERETSIAGTHVVAPRQNWDLWSIQTKRSRLPVYFLIWIVGVVALGATVFETTNKLQSGKRKDELAGACNMRTKMLQDQFENQVNKTNTLAVHLTQLHRLNHLLDEKEQEEFLKNYMLATMQFHPYLEAVSVTGYIIGNGYTTSSVTQDIDIYGSPRRPVLRKHDIVKAVATGKTSISRPYFDSRQVRFAMAYPIYKASLTLNSTLDQRCSAISGYMGAIFRFDTFADHVLRQLDGQDTISVSVYDVTESPNCLLLYRSGDNDFSHYLHESKLDLGDSCRQHRVVCRYSKKPPVSWIPIAFTSLTIVIGLQLGCILLGSVHHRLKIQELDAQAKASKAATCEYLSTASRDIQKPAYTILETLRLLYQTDLTSQQREYIQSAQEGCKNLIALIAEMTNADTI